MWVWKKKPTCHFLKKYEAEPVKLNNFTSRHCGINLQEDASHWVSHPCTHRAVKAVTHWAKCQTSSRILTDTEGLELVLGVGDRWTVTSAIPAAAAHTAVTLDSQEPGYQALFLGTNYAELPRLLLWSLLSCPPPPQSQVEHNQYRHPVAMLFQNKRSHPVKDVLRRKHRSGQKRKGLKTRSWNKIRKLYETGPQEIVRLS